MIKETPHPVTPEDVWAAIYELQRFQAESALRLDRYIVESQERERVRIAVY